QWVSPVAAAPSQRSPDTAKPDNGNPIFLILAIAIPLLLLMVQSIGDMPSEPLGGGSRRELVIGIGRPLILFLVGLGIIVVACPPSPAGPTAPPEGSRAFCSSSAPPADCSGFVSKPAWRKCSANTCSIGMSDRLPW